GVIHGGRAVTPDPDALRCLPLGFAHIEPVRARALAPIDALGGLAGLVLTELPEGLALTHAPTAVHTLRHRDRNALRLHHTRWQLGSELLGVMAKRALRGGRGHQGSGERPQRSGAIRRSITCGIVMPSARAAKLSAMR